MSDTFNKYLEMAGRSKDHGKEKDISGMKKFIIKKMVGSDFNHLSSKDKFRTIQAIAEQYAGLVTGESSVAEERKRWNSLYANPQKPIDSDEEEDEENEDDDWEHADDDDGIETEEEPEEDEGK